MFNTNIRNASDWRERETVGKIVSYFEKEIDDLKINLEKSKTNLKNEIKNFEINLHDEKETSEELLKQSEIWHQIQLNKKDKEILELKIMLQGKAIFDLNERLEKLESKLENYLDENLSLKTEEELTIQHSIQQSV